MCSCHAPHPHYTVEPMLENADDAEQAAAATADLILRRSRRDDDTLLFNTAEGRRGAGKVGADPRVSAANAVVADSSHPSDLASVIARTEVTMLAAGALAAMPDHAGLQASESIGIGSEKGFVTAERQL